MKKGSDNISIIIFISVTIIIVIRLICSFLPETRVWGLNHAAFIDGLFALYPLLFCITILLYVKRRKYFRPSTPELFNEHITGPLGRLLPALIIIVAGAVFYLLQVNSHFLGDGYTMIANPHMSIKYREYGEAIIHLWLLQALASPTSESVRLVYQAVSVVCGVLFVLALVYYARKITTTVFSYYAFIGLNLLAANTVLYYGYVENYSIVTMILSVCILSAIAALRNRKKSPLPLILFALAVFLHTISLVYLPALVIYMSITYLGDSIRRFIIERIKIILTSMCVGFVLVYIGVKLWAPLFWQLALLAPYGDRFTIDNYYLMSINHIVDFINLLFLLIPVSLVSLLALWYEKRNAEKSNSHPERIFLWIASIFGLLSAFVIDPKLGMARDWDLMSIILIGAGFAGIYLWIEEFQKARWFKSATLILAILGLSVFTPWLVLNNSVEGLYSYNMTAMERDPKRSRPGFYTMGALANQVGNRAESDRLKRYCQTHFPERRLDREGGALYRQGDYARAEVLFMQALKENPAWFALYMDLGMTQIKLGKYYDALENLKIADALNPYNALIYNFIGEAYRSLGDIPSAINYWNKSIARDYTIPEPYISMGQFYLQRQKPDSALYCFTLLPDESYPTEIFYYRGLSHLLIGDTTSAFKNFERYLHLGKDQKLKDEINVFVEELKD